LESPLVVIFGGQTSEQEQCRQGLHHQLWKLEANHNVLSNWINLRNIL
jgi:hypothetical protein